MEYIKLHIKEMECGDVDSICLVQNRVLWWALNEDLNENSGSINQGNSLQD
jgi:hypothetical protein